MKRMPRVVYRSSEGGRGGSGQAGVVRAPPKILCIYRSTIIMDVHWSIHYIKSIDQVPVRMVSVSTRCDRIFNSVNIYTPQEGYRQMEAKNKGCIKKRIVRLQKIEVTCTGHLPAVSGN
eukprot:SAG31_NODE_186_length_20918_cov_26.890917_10_plen_119_part_00